MHRSKKEGNDKVLAFIFSLQNFFVRRECSFFCTMRRCKIPRIVRAASAIFADRRKMLTRAEESF